MSLNQRPRIHYLLLVCSCYLLPLYTLSTPLPNPQNGRVRTNTNTINCAHDSVAHLIKSSPIILKALAARIFSDSDLATSELWQSVSNTADTTTSRSRKDFTSNEPNQILITLTPATVYKGASLLKTTQASKSTVRLTESSYQFEGQLNATLEPLSCFDTNVLKMLPTELIAFGKLVTVQQQQQQLQQTLKQQNGQAQQQEPQQQIQQRSSNDQQQHSADILRVSINGLHRWSPQFENHIWKHLGWDDWSDFTLCSVTCGKGVQQRFRRCLLDNPMMNLNINMNSNQDDEDEANADINEYDNDVADDSFETLDNRLDLDTVNSNSNNNNIYNIEVNKQNKGEPVEELNNKHMMLKSRPRKLLSTAATLTVANTIHQKRRNTPKQWFTNSKDFQPKIDNVVGNDNVAKDDDNYSVDDDNDEVMRVFEGDFSNNEESSTTAATKSAGGTSNQNFIIATKPSKTNLRKKKKSAKSISTLFCEGYNIEQRNCNTFECSDDISELLKFYRKLSMPEDLSTSSIFVTQPLTSELNTLSSMATSIITTTTTSTATLLSSSLPTATAAQQSVAIGNGNGAGAGVGVAPSSTPANMGYVKSWHNNSNFTIMITLRVKNDTKTTGRIFSIRNTTHNLYLEPSTEGLRLYLERDKTTEMLPVKFNLYDNRWHQVAISIQNGDFISIFVDCSWSNSFVVSKRLFSLPQDAEVEIGHGFDGELQQLLVLPDNQERQQCSNVRTSINEVKRYIIDTFIDDYSN